MTQLVPLNKHELDFIIGILKSEKLRAEQKRSLSESMDDYPDMIQHMIKKLEKYWVEESDEGKK